MVLSENEVYTQTDKVNNIEIHERKIKECEIVNSIKSSLKNLDHIMMGLKYNLLQLIMQGKIKSNHSLGNIKLPD